MPEIFYREAVRTSGSIEDGIDFVLSTEDRVRDGHIIEARGWQLGNFKRNPIALFGHRHDSIVGTWTKVRVEGQRLLGRLRLAAAGTSELVDTVRALIEQGILRAVSIGFLPVEYVPLDPENPWDGYRITKVELLEASLVAVGADPKALQGARQLGVPPHLMARLFVKPDVQQPVLVPPGASAATLPTRTRTMNLGEKISKLDQELGGLREDLAAIHNAVDDGTAELTDEQMGRADELVRQIEARSRELDRLKVFEGTRQRTASPPGTRLPAISEERPAITPARALPTVKVERKKAEILIRMLASHYVGFVRRQDPFATARQMWPDDSEMHTCLRAVSAPADTTTVGWAKELVQTQIGELLELLVPYSVYARLTQIGVRVTFGRYGAISLPAASSGKLAGSFVGEGQPIPVKQGLVSAVTMSPHKLAVISTFTRELADSSNPQIEDLIRRLILADTATALDVQLLDAVAASAIRPAGLRNAAAWGTVSNASAGAGISNIAKDLQTALTALVSANAATRPVIIMNPLQELSLRFAMTPLGTFPLASAGNGASLFDTLTIISSTNVPAGVVIVLDGSSFASATGDTPQFDVSEQATLHMASDVAPAPTASPIIGGTGTAALGDVASPVRSLWQTATIGVRMMMFVTWAMRRQGVVSVITGVAW